jgi:hypothetical protein
MVRSINQFPLLTSQLNYDTDVNSLRTGVSIRNLNKTATHTFFTKIFASCENFTITTRTVSGHKNFTAWEWEASFNYVKVMEEVASEEAFTPKMADGGLIRMVGVSLIWWNDDGKIVKNNDYTKAILDK